MAIILDTLPAISAADFGQALKYRLESLPAGSLPLEQGTSQGGYVDDSNISVTVISISEKNGRIQGKIGVFFTEIVVGCGCGDDPFPVNAYCELQLSLDNNSAEAEFEVMQT
ncbi:MAG: glucosamine--fructose-6-phosphate aminotransferase [Gammaproteobacteria bacterium]|jgi:hypothetical protein